MLRCLLAWFPFDLTRVSECGSVKSASMSRLSLSERLWGGRVSDPPVKAGAERKKKTAGLFLEGGNPGGAPSRRGGNPAAAQSRSKALKNTTRQSKKKASVELQKRRAGDSRVTGPWISLDTAISYSAGTECVEEVPGGSPGPGLHWRVGRRPPVAACPPAPATCPAHNRSTRSRPVNADRGR